MSQTATDRNLLFAILAVQMDFVRRDALIAAMNAWAIAKDKPLGQILEEQDCLSADRHRLLDALVAEHIKEHDNDPGKSLAALHNSAATHDHLQKITDPDLCRSLTSAAARASDVFMTRAPSVGEAAAVGSRFRILRPHAKGGLGQVFVAEDGELHREVALKEIQERHADNPHSRARFVLEAEITGGLEHPGIVPVYGLGQYADGRPYYAMRFIRGDSMKEAIERFYNGRAGGANHPMEPGERAVAFRQLLGRFVTVCDVIAYAHSRGVLHRDLKPDNIMLGKYGETIVVDWGLAKPLGELRESKETDEVPLHPAAVSASVETMAGSTLGTPQYMSPEQAAGQLKRIYPPSDVYSLGATLYCLLTGQPPFTDADAGAVLRKVQKGDFLRPRLVRRHLPPALEAVCLKAMALKPEDRYPSPRALADDIDHWLADEPVSAYRERWTKRLRRWSRSHQVLVTAAVVLFLAGFAAAAIVTRERTLTEEAETRRVNAQVDTLLHTSAESVPRALDELAPLRAVAAPILRSKLDDPGLSGRIRVRAALGLLPADPTLTDFVSNYMLQENDPHEVIMVRDVLTPHGGEVALRLWPVAEDPNAPRPHCLRALVALARFDPDSSRWNAVAERGVTALLDDWHLPIWIEALRPVRAILEVPLAKVFRESTDADDRLASAQILADYDADHPGLLTDLLLDADPKQYVILWPKVKDHRASFPPLLQAELDKKLPANLFDPEGERLARRQAQAAVTLLRLELPERIWPYLRLTPDPRLRSYLVHLLEPLHTDQVMLIAHWGLETDVSIRRALLLAFGLYPQQSPVENREQVLARLLRHYEEDPDPGLHSAIDWLARHRWGMRERIVKVDKALAGKPPGERRWFVTSELHTMAVVPGPIEFDMGSTEQEPGRYVDEALHRVRIPRAFAMATKQVTVEQFHQFLKANPQIKHRLDNPSSPDRLGPIIHVDWFLAAKYCRWLSEVEEVPEDQMCFPPIAEIKEGMKLPADYLRRTGYRMPTEAESEYACRAGTVTSRYYGNAVSLLASYAWYEADTRHRTMPVGRLMPNDLGLFDALGNVREWCMDRYGNYPTEMRNEDTEGPLLVTGTDTRVIRGGGFLDLESSIRCASRRSQRPSERFRTDGLRIARTMPAR